MTDTKITKGSYVIATKYDDGDPGDAWAVGYFISETPQGRYLVGDLNGNLFYGPKGFKRIRANLKADVGTWLVDNSGVLEKSPPGSINIWTMLTDSAFNDYNDVGIGKIN